uniref:CLK4-associating serine/arginine rich protein isoform X2 n=1 Tax=Rhizophora mucronata TaxID=61149 RepID=A0A2P2LA19_RHIMU
MVVPYLILSGKLGPDLFGPRRNLKKKKN